MKKIDLKKFSKSKTDWAGKVLCDSSRSEEDKNVALEILSNWRAAHSYPMHIFTNRLRRISGSLDSGALVAQRLKRVPSIIKKLKRSYGGKKASMKLSQMQDIAGCRVVMSDIDLVRKIYSEYYVNGDLKHEKVNEKNYILNPKSDGYRSIHLIYRFFSDKGKADYNGLLVEVQIRSKLQHLWATAVETVDFFTRQAIKSNQGQKDWADFFRLVSSAFALFEGCSSVPGVPIREKELYAMIFKMEKELQVRRKMKSWMESIEVLDEMKSKYGSSYFLLELDTVRGKLIVTGYSKKQEKRALREYSEVEKRIYGRPEYDVVLVGADTSEDLKKVYPNYFLDTRDFIRYLNLILKKVK